MTGCYSFKAPSANAPAATARRLVSTPLVPSFHLIPLQKHSSDRQDSGPKNVFMGKIPTSYLPNLFEFSGAANGRLRLVD
jgi:hypothetical protein